MTGVTEIYRAYGDLIKYLEEKFPGCVDVPLGTDNTVYAQAEGSKHLLTVDPTTQTTIERFIRTACNRFNETGSTFLQIYYEGSKTLIVTPNVTPTLWVLYRLSIRTKPAEDLHHSHPDVGYKSLPAIRRWLEVLTASQIGALDLQAIGRTEELYGLISARRGRRVHPEKQQIKNWIKLHENALNKRS